VGLIPFHADEWLTVYGGDSLNVLAELEPASVHTVITSPPYYGLRDYGVDGQLGQEATPDEYVANLVAICGRIKQVLRLDGTFWLNLGDGYAANRSYQVTDNKSVDVGNTKGSKVPPGFKAKDLLGIPWMVAFALRVDGWYLRSDIIWNKPNPMPESVDDRPTLSHEHVFLLTRSPSYFYDSEAVKEPISEAMAAAIARGPRSDRRFKHDEHNRNGKRSGNRAFSDPSSLARIALGRNRRSVWTIPTVAYPGAHYATFPAKLVEPMILAGTSEKGVCSICGNPSVRQTETTSLDHHETSKDGKTLDGPYAAQAAIRNGVYVDTKTVGWRRTCEHPGHLVPATVLDPFAGSGTVGMVANRLSRRATLVDINPEYLKQQMERNSQVPMGL